MLQELLVICVYKHTMMAPAGCGVGGCYYFIQNSTQLPTINILRIRAILVYKAILASQKHMKKPANERMMKVHAQNELFNKISILHT